jgi:outer membrane protein assembly factor BamE (lipoprotein component of BamABCDE complex)
MFLRARLPILAVAASACLMASACTPVTKYQGFMVLDEDPTTAKVGEDTMASVRTRFGSPTTISTFEPNIWYYMAQTTDNFGAYRPRLRARSIVAITFDKESQKVANVKTLDANDGRVIAYSGRETPTTGRQLSIWEQLLSTIGTTMLPPQDVDPGDLPGTIDRR